MRKIYACLFVIIPICQNVVAMNSSNLSGLWKGSGKDPVREFDNIVLTGDPANFYWRIDYGKNGNPFYCGGYWTQTGDASFRETIIYGECIKDYCEIILPNPTALHYTCGLFKGTLVRLYSFC